MKRRTLLVAAIALIVLAGVLFQFYGGSRTPPGQPPLARLNLATLQQQFNQARNSIRIVALLSPT